MPTSLDILRNLSPGGRSRDLNDYLDYDELGDTLEHNLDLEKQYGNIYPSRTPYGPAPAQNYASGATPSDVAHLRRTQDENYGPQRQQVKDFDTAQLDALLKGFGSNNDLPSQKEGEYNRKVVDQRTTMPLQVEQEKGRNEQSLDRQRFDRVSSLLSGGAGAGGPNKSTYRMNFDSQMRPSMIQDIVPAQLKVRANTAGKVGSHIDQVRQEAAELDSLGALGPIAGRWNNFLIKGLGSAELAGYSPEVRQKIQKFRTDVGLLQSGVAMVHGGVRGGGSPMLIKRFEDYMNANQMDLPELYGGLDSFRDWMNGYSDMDQGLGDLPQTPDQSSVGQSAGQWVPGQGIVPYKGGR